MKKIVFIYHVNSNDSDGIILKINNLSKSFANEDFIVLNHPIYLTFGLITSITRLYSSLKYKSEIYFIRYNNSRNILFLPLLILLKILGKKIIIEVPTPIINNYQEISLSKSSLLKKIAIYFSTTILGPIPFAFSDLVIQYSNESRFFSLLTKKTILIGNGIDVNYYSSYKPDFKKYCTNRVYKIVVIANLAPWHGVDLLLMALQKVAFDFVLHIIGDGPEKTNLIKLTADLGISNYTVFHGNLSRDKYIHIMKDAHLGIGSLNWDIVKVKISSALKLREYVSVGLPVIFSSYDPDLSGEKNCYQVDCNIKSIEDALNLSFNNYKYFNYSDQISLALRKLDMSIKVKKIIKEL